MKIGLFGGTFDPPHKGHTGLAYDFYNESKPDLLVVMPSFIPPHKANAICSAVHRFNMTRLAFLCMGETGVNYQISDYEITKNNVSYTIDTVNYLLERYQTDKIHLCIGSDMLFSFEKWTNATELMSRCVLYSKARYPDEQNPLLKHAEYLKSTYNADVHIMNGTIINVSSTLLRTELNEELIDDRVLKYIKDNGLYR